MNRPAGVLRMSRVAFAALLAASIADRSAAQQGNTKTSADDLSESAGQLLDRSFSLERRGPAGEARQYCLRRENLTTDREGAIIRTDVIELRFERKLLDTRTDDHRDERWTWTRYATGSATGDDAEPPLTPVAELPTIAYAMPPSQTIEPTGLQNLAAITDPMAAMYATVMALDAATWDYPLAVLRRKVGQTVHIGNETTEDTWDEPLALRDASGMNKVGTYVLGALHIRVSGLTRIGNEPCLVIRFDADNNRIKQSLKFGPMAVRVSGTEYFRGVIHVSLADGRVVSGELWGPVVQQVFVGRGENEPARQPIGSVLQYVTYEEIAPKAD